MDDDAQRQARSFGSVAEAYDRGRPAFPPEAVEWLCGPDPATVLELGAGTGKLTAGLVERGHDVHATEPDPRMLAVLRRNLPDVPTSESAAEEIPLPDRSVDVVVAGQSFHWFDHERALPEIARVLRPGGHLALAWNTRDEQIPWVRKLGPLLGSPGAAAEATGSTEHVVQSDLFGFLDELRLHFWQQVDRESIVDMAASRSYVATLPDEEREAVLSRVLAFYEDYGRGMDGMQLPYDCQCYRTRVVDRVDDEPEATEAADSPDATDDGPRVSDGTDTDMLLIDFR